MAKTDNEILQTFGANLKRIRMQKGFTLRDLEAYSGVANSKISKMESGETNVTILTLVKLAKGLEIRLEELASDNVLGL